MSYIELSALDLQAIADAVDLQLGGRWGFSFPAMMERVDGKKLSPYLCIATQDDTAGFTLYELGLAIGYGAGLNIIPVRIQNALRETRTTQDEDLGLIVVFPQCSVDPMVAARAKWSHPTT